MSSFSFENLKLIEELYQSYRQDPNSVELSWHYFFQGWDLANTLSSSLQEGSSDELRIYYLIQAFRLYGHLKAQVSTLSLTKKEQVAELDYQNYGFSSEDLKKVFPVSCFLKDFSFSTPELVCAPLLR